MDVEPSSVKCDGVTIPKTSNVSVCLDEAYSNFIDLTSLTIGSSLALAPGKHLVLMVNELDITPGATFDLNNSDLIAPAKQRWSGHRRAQNGI